MNACPRCLRYHRGICGVPAGVTRAFGAHAVGSHAAPSPSGARFKSGKPGTGTLDHLLQWGLQERAKVMEMLRAVPPGMEEYDPLLKRLDWLDDVLGQVRQQLGTRRA